jgi:hypothetical protein
MLLGLTNSQFSASYSRLNLSLHILPTATVGFKQSFESNFLASLFDHQAILSGRYICLCEITLVKRDNANRRISVSYKYPLGDLNPGPL